MAIDCIGIDIGYGFTKTCRSEKDRQIFPTAVAMMAKEGAFAEMSPVVVNGHRYLVGKEAEREGGTIDTRQSGFVASDAWLAVLGHCLRINDFSNGEIVLGVPPGMYAKEYSRKIVDAIRASDIRVNGEPYRVSGNIRIIPQGAGIFFRHIKDYPEDFRKNVAVIDIGHHTVDMVFFAEGKYVESATESQEIGVSFVLDSIVNSLLSGAQALHRLQGGPRHPPGQADQLHRHPLPGGRPGRDRWLREAGLLVRGPLSGEAPRSCRPGHHRRGRRRDERLSGQASPAHRERAGHGERNRVLALRQECKIGRRRWRKTSSSTGCTSTRRSRRSSTNCSKACRNPSGDSTSGRPWSTIVSRKGCRLRNRRVGTSPFKGPYDEDFGGRGVSMAPAGQAGQLRCDRL